MKRSYLFLLFVCQIFILMANDGAFFTSGNHLIPISETDISVKKEILSINRINAQQVEVMVYYEFHNPKNDKKLTVGFEAMSPSGDAQVSPIEGRHPYISDFTVEVNDKILSYKVALVDDSLYYKDGSVNELNSTQISDKTYDGWAEYSYVYYFDATFKSGLNVVKHTYTFDLSGGVMYNYNFDYVLSAAMRWGNKQIDDFTLIINMGDFQDYHVRRTFFDSSKEWIITGIGKLEDSVPVLPFLNEDGEIQENEKATQFYIRKGTIIFKKQDFKPKGELYLVSPRIMQQNYESFNYKEQAVLPLTTELYYESTETDEVSKKILRNLPFAKRGYVFSNPVLRQYYNNQPWYIPNPSYKSKMDDLTKSEQEWVVRWSE